eukprot:Rmarinus@m.17587
MGLQLLYLIFLWGFDTVGFIMGDKSGETIDLLALIFEDSQGILVSLIYLTQATIRREIELDKVYFSVRWRLGAALRWLRARLCGGSQGEQGSKASGNQSSTRGGMDVSPNDTDDDDEEFEPEVTIEPLDISHRSRRLIGSITSIAATRGSIFSQNIPPLLSSTTPNSTAGSTYSSEIELPAAIHSSPLP